MLLIHMFLFITLLFIFNTCTSLCEFTLAFSHSRFIIKKCIYHILCWNLLKKNIFIIHIKHEHFKNVDDRCITTFKTIHWQQSSNSHWHLSQGHHQLVFFIQNVPPEPSSASSSRQHTGSDSLPSIRLSGQHPDILPDESSKNNPTRSFPAAAAFVRVSWQHFSRQKSEYGRALERAAECRHAVAIGRVFWRICVNSVFSVMSYAGDVDEMRMCCLFLKNRIVLVNVCFFIIKKINWSILIIGIKIIFVVLSL